MFAGNIHMCTRVCSGVPLTAQMFSNTALPTSGSPWLGALVYPHLAHNTSSLPLATAVSCKCVQLSVKDTGLFLECSSYLSIEITLLHPSNLKCCFLRGAPAPPLRTSHAYLPPRLHRLPLPAFILLLQVDIGSRDI